MGLDERLRKLERLIVGAGDADRSIYGLIGLRWLTAAGDERERLAAQMAEIESRHPDLLEEGRPISEMRWLAEFEPRGEPES
jgi:hypothetical protein